MSDNPERSVLEAIDELVEWQLTEGRQREDRLEEFDFEALARFDPVAFARAAARVRAAMAGMAHSTSAAAGQLSKARQLIETYEQAGGGSKP